MKQKVSVPTAIAAVVVVVGLAAFAWFRLAGSPQGTASGGPPPLPPSVGAALQQHAPKGQTAPSKQAGAPSMQMLRGAMGAPPTQSR